MQANGTSGCCPMAGLSLRKIIPCRHSGSTPYWSLRAATKCSHLEHKMSGNVESLKETLRRGHEELKNRFFAEESVDELVRARAALVDTVLREAWQGSESLALVAVGGYGRGELHPCSDVDLLLLAPQPLDAEGRTRVEK